MRFLLTLVLTGALAIVGCGDDATGTGGSGGDGATGGGTAGTGGGTGGVGGGTGGTGGSTGTTFNLSFRGVGYQGPHNGQTMHFALYDDADDTTAVNTWEVTVDADPLVASWPDALTEGQSYRLYYYVDTNANDACDGPALNMDHAWSMPIAAATAAVEVTDTHSTLNFDDGACAKF